LSLPKSGKGRIVKSRKLLRIYRELRVSNMKNNRIMALSFDTGGTVLDWHSSFKKAFSNVGSRHNLECDWALLANDLRQRSLNMMLKLGEKTPPDKNIDEAHYIAVNQICEEYNLNVFTQEDRHAIAWESFHNSLVWPDFKKAFLRLRSNYIVCSHTILSFRLIIDSSRKNNVNWDAVFSCEAIGKYKTLIDSYKKVASWLALEPHQICKVACHTSDLDAARQAGFITAFVHRPMEWGAPGPPSLNDVSPKPDYDVVVNTFQELVKALQALKLG